MTTFWKLLLVRGDGRSDAAAAAGFGHALYELWFRCDLCYKSDPYPAAYRWRSGPQESTLCAACDQKMQLQGDLDRDGWTRVP